MVLVPLPFIVLLRDLWATPADSPSPTELKSTTLWKQGRADRQRHHLPPHQGRGHPGRWPGQLRPGGAARGRGARGQPERPRQVGPDPDPDAAGRDRLPAGRGLGATRGSWPSPRSAPTSVARSPCTSSARITCCAPAISRPSTWPIRATSSSVPRRDGCHSCRSRSTARATWSRWTTSLNPSGPASSSVRRGSHERHRQSGRSNRDLHR